MSCEEWDSAEPFRVQALAWAGAGRCFNGAVVALMASVVAGCTPQLDDLALGTMVATQSASGTGSAWASASSSAPSDMSGIVTALNPLKPGSATASPSLELDAGMFAGDAESEITISPEAGSALPRSVVDRDAGSDAGSAAASGCEAANAPFIYVYAVDPTTIQVDGDLAQDWFDACWVALTTMGQSSVVDGATQVALRYSSETLYVAVRTQDPVHVGPSASTPNSDIWKFDAVQLALDDLSKSSGTDPYEYEYGCSLSAADKVVGYRWYPASAAAPDLVQAAVRVEAGETRYEIAIPRSALGGKAFGPTLALKLDVAVCDGSGGAAASNPWSYRELAPGLVQDNVANKSSSAFLQVIWKSDD